MKRIVSPHIARPDRLPPGQGWRDKPIVYDIDTPPGFDQAGYRLRILGAVERPVELSYAEITSMPQVELLADFHCVTRWSVKEMLWQGLETQAIAALAGVLPQARFVMIHSLEGYTTNLPIEHFLAQDSILALGLEGKPLPVAHGRPVRLVVPSLYVWKSAKYVTGIEFMPDDKPGYWEERGYHMRGEPWAEERYR